MVRSVLQDKRVLLGDIVIFHYQDGMDNSTSPLKLTGRIVAKLNTESAIRYAHEAGDYYLLVPRKLHMPKLKDPHDPINFFRPRTDKLQFEWGGYPKEDHICVARQYIVHASIPGMMDFKKMGVCPRCGDTGYWKALALNCNWHGQFI